MKPLTFLYHGTKYKYVVDGILKTGFQPLTFFSRDLSDAISMGGKYVFMVVFTDEDLPDNWQVRCKNAIPPSRIYSLQKHQVTTIVKYDKKIGFEVDDSNSAFTQPDYMFSEKDPDFITKLI